MSFGRSIVIPRDVVEFTHQSYDWSVWCFEGDYFVVCESAVNWSCMCDIHGIRQRIFQNNYWNLIVMETLKCQSIYIKQNMLKQWNGISSLCIAERFKNSYLLIRFVFRWGFSVSEENVFIEDTVLQSIIKRYDMRLIVFYTEIWI